MYMYPKETEKLSLNYGRNRADIVPYILLYGFDLKHILIGVLKWLLQNTNAFPFKSLFLMILLLGFDIYNKNVFSHS